jgi:hypothetical protein
MAAGAEDPVIPARTLLAALVLFGATGCFYTHGNVNLLRHEDPVVTFEAHDRRDGALRNLGRVRATARGWLFEDCDAIAERAVARLATAGSARGGNRISGFRFRGHWTWISEPVCRRNLSYVLLIVPAFLPVPTSATVSGIAIHVAEGAAGP